MSDISEAAFFCIRREQLHFSDPVKKDEGKKCMPKLMNRGPEPTENAKENPASHQFVTQVLTGCGNKMHQHCKYNGWTEKHKNLRQC